MFLIRLILFSSLLMILACSQGPEKQLINILETNYANLYINEAHKREVIKELQEFLDSHSISEGNLPKIQKLIHKLGDGHVVIESETSRNAPLFLSELEFFPGSNFVKSCAECSPTLKEGKYQILEVNNQPISDYIKSHQFSVSASTPWGKEYRIINNLSESHLNPRVSLMLKSHSGSKTTINLSWKEKEKTKPECVSGERIDQNIFKLNILSLWCSDPQSEKNSRKEVLIRFKDQFQEAISSIKEDDFIILDLRVNGGGGDPEVEYVLNTFNKNSTFMYRYKHLNRFHFLKGISSFLNFIPIWDKDHLETTVPANRPDHHLFNNKMVTLISAGCFSSCEGLASSLKNEHRSLLMGTKTHGGIGEPIFMPLRNTPYEINIPIALTFQKDGELFEGRGVYPDIEMSQVKSINRDSVLDAAIELGRQP